MKGEDEGVGNLLAARVVPALPNYVSTPTRQEVPIDQVRRLDGRRSRLNRWEAGWYVGSRSGASGLGIRWRNRVSPTVRDRPAEARRRVATCHSPQLNLPFWDPSLSQLFVDWLAGRLIACFSLFSGFAPLTFRRTMHRLRSVLYSKHRTPVRYSK